MTSLELAQRAAAFLDSKKAERLSVIEIENISSLADYFVIATGNNNTHVRALADELEEKLKAEGLPPARWRATGPTPGFCWTGQCGGSYLYQEGRDFYDLDRLWADGKKVDWSSAGEA